MVAAGCLQVPSDVIRWPLLITFPVLGHAIQHNGSIRACWTRARASMWKAFWANPGANDARRLENSSKLISLKRAVTPQLSFRCSRWPPQRQISAELDQLQQKMTASLLECRELKMKMQRVTCGDVADLREDFDSSRAPGHPGGSAEPLNGMSISHDIEIFILGLQDCGSTGESSG